MTVAVADLDRAALEAGTATEEQRAKRVARLRAMADEAGVWPASIGPIYRGLAQGDLPPMTVPAMNLRGLTYDAARAAWRAARALDAGPTMFELAPSEADVSKQRFDEYAAMVLAAAAREGHRGPVFLQGDHFGLYEDTSEDFASVQALGREALSAGLMQIDIDAAGLADMAADDPYERQKGNARATARMIVALRSKAGGDVRGDVGGDIVFGGEVGEIGGENTDPADLRAFLDQVTAAMPDGVPGLGKVSVQTGTRHGGIVTAAGGTAEMPLDVSLVTQLSGIARDEYGLPGVVQHGASTLTTQQLAQLPEAGVIEVHLATGIQNLILDHPALPAELLERMKRELVGPVSHAESGVYDEAKTPEQKFYQNRWRAWGQYKHELWSMPDPVKQEIGDTLEAWFRELFTALQVAGKRAALDLVAQSR